jgi:CubicO group peptidase (beta-lactamase class C family)
MKRSLLSLLYIFIPTLFVFSPLCAQTVDEIYKSLSLKQKVASLFVVNTPQQKVADLIPCGYISAPGDKSVLPGNGLKLVDITQPTNDKCAVPFPNTNVLAACGNQYLIMPLFAGVIKDFPGASGLITSAFPLGLKHLKLAINQPQPAQIVIFKDALSKSLPAENDHIAGLIPLPAMFMKFQSSQGVSGVGDKSHFTLFKNWKHVTSEPSPMGFTLEDVLQLPYLFSTTNLAEDVEKLARAVNNNLVDKTLFEKRVKWIISCQLAMKGSVTSKAPSNAKSSLVQQELIRRHIFESSLVLARDTDAILPLRHLIDKDVVFADARNQKIGEPALHLQFQQVTARWMDNGDIIDSLQFDYSKQKILFLLVDNDKKVPELTLQAYRLKNRYPKIKIGLILCNSLSSTSFIRNDYSVFDMVIIGYDSVPLIWEGAVDAIYGGLPFEGNTVMDLFNLSKAGKQVHYPKIRMKIGLPAEVGMSADTLKMIDTIIKDAIEAHATPGAQVLVARNGMVVYNKAFGFSTYDSSANVSVSSLYDIASITKIMATTPMMMHLYDRNKVLIESPLKNYLPETAKTNKANILISELLIHKAGLQASVPTFYNAIDRSVITGKLFNRLPTGQYSFQVDDHLFLNRDVTLRRDVIKNVTDSVFSVEVAKNIYLNYHFRDSMYQQMLASPVDKIKSYRYSDMGLCFLQHVIEKVVHKPLKCMVDSVLYAPMDLTALTYLPLLRFKPEQIVPTERDDVFRQQLIHGYVHDPGAAMLGGVAGHAGLFSNAGDLAKMMQMYLNNGSYGGMQLVKPETVKLFTSRYNDTVRRGLGFDKPELKTSKTNPACDSASEKSFGHLGFTGCVAWADPQNGLIFILLSNRVYPHSWNKRLIQYEIRTKAMQVAYDAIKQ